MTMCKSERLIAIDFNPAAAARLRLRRDPPSTVSAVGADRTDKPGTATAEGIGRSSHQGLDKSRPLALARWPRRWETKADPHAAGRFTRSVATRSTFGAATVRATARCPLRLRVFRRRARDPRSSAPAPYRQRIASQSREPGIGPSVHYAAMPAQKHRS